MPRGTDISGLKRDYRTAKEADEKDFPDRLTITLQKEEDLPLRYGENPMQTAVMYRFVDVKSLPTLRVVKQGKEGISATNWMDIAKAMDLLKFFPKPSATATPAVPVMKHNIPSGFATQSGDASMVDTYVKARDADARSAYGSVVVLNRPLDKATAEAIMDTYVEVVAAPGYEPGTVDMLETPKRKDLRAVIFSGIEKIPKFVGDDTQGLYDLKMLPGGRVIAQKPYLTSIRGKEDLVFDGFDGKDPNGKFEPVKRDPTDQELEDMLTAWYVNFGVRSNGIVIVKNGATLVVGSGQQERVGAVEQAIVKGFQKAFDRAGIDYDHLTGIVGRNKLPEEPFEGAVLSSDAFFPDRDSIDTAGRVGIKGIIQPGGSRKDYEVIEAVNKYGMAMALTGERCFGHF
jgi:phosphoribosylaminoimidazolecarboxamide formyltransferase/IMP cyclohydrolase